MRTDHINVFRSVCVCIHIYTHTNIYMYDMWCVCMCVSLSSKTQERPFACSHQFPFTFAFTLEKMTVCFLSDILNLDLNFLYKWKKKKNARIKVPIPYVLHYSQLWHPVATHVNCSYELHSYLIPPYIHYSWDFSVIIWAEFFGLRKQT